MNKSCIIIVILCLCVLQEESLNNQKRLIRNGQELHNDLKSAREEVSNAFTSIEQQAWSFKEQFNEVSASDVCRCNHF